MTFNNILKSITHEELLIILEAANMRVELASWAKVQCGLIINGVRYIKVNDKYLALALSDIEKYSLNNLGRKLKKQPEHKKHVTQELLKNKTDNCENMNIFKVNEDSLVGRIAAAFQYKVSVRNSVNNVRLYTLHDLKVGDIKYGSQKSISDGTVVVWSLEKLSNTPKLIVINPEEWWSESDMIKSFLGIKDQENDPVAGMKFAILLSALSCAPNAALENMVQYTSDEMTSGEFLTFLIN